MAPRMAGPRLVSFGVVLLALAACATASQPAARRASSPLAQAVLQRDREAAAKLEAVRSDLAALRARVDRRQSQRSAVPAAEMARWHEESQLLDQIREQLTAVRAALAQLLATDSTLSALRRGHQPGSPQLRVDEIIVESQVLGSARAYEFGLATHDQLWARETQMAGLEVDAAGYAGAPDETVSWLRHRFLLHQRVLAARRDLRETWDFFLSSMRYASVAELQEQRRRQYAAQDAARLARDREIDQTFRRLVVTFGIVAAVTAVLTSEHATPGHRHEGMQNLESAKHQGIADCLVRRGRWTDGGPRAVGTCALP